MVLRSFVLFCGLMVFFSGCASDKEVENVAAQQTVNIQNLNEQVSKLNEDLEKTLQAKDELAKAQLELEKQLHEELEAGNMSVSLQDRGLVVTVLDRVLFDSGKAELKETSLISLDKLANVLNETVSDRMVYIEGHTDNVPIQLSGWRSNWELSTARATEVIHYLVDQNGFVPERLAAVGYGEFHPVASNASPQGRLLNRRVEIVVSPKKFTSA